jgi:ABC-type transporter Mla subunit MlaD
MDELEQIVHLVAEALAKARILSTIPLDAESRAKAAELMKEAKQSYEKMEALNQASQSNGKGLDKATLDAALDELIATFKGVNQKLDELLAKARS